MSETVRLLLQACTDAGLQRDNNEDAHALDPDLGLAVLADGMGGSQAGEIAAEMAVQIIRQEMAAGLERRPDLLSPSLDDTAALNLEALLRTAVTRANSAILERSRRDPACRGMGTTVVAALWRGTDLIVGHAGDSRAYRLRRRALPLPLARLAPVEIQRLTRDHVVGQTVVDADQGADRDAATPERHDHTLTRAVGVEESLVLEIHRHRLQPGDIILLCSDGLSDMLADGVIERVATQAGAHVPDMPAGGPDMPPRSDRAEGLSARARDDLARLAQALLSEALQAGGHDNVTLVLGTVVPDGPAQET